MIPQKGQHVQCLHRLGGTVEGIVEKWSEEESILRTLDGKHILLIPKTAEDIRLIKISLPEKTVPEIKNAIKEKLNEVQQPTGDPEADAFNLKELRKMVIEQEKKIIADKIKEHHIGDVKKVTYGFPTFARTK
jgi:hypothetical protein